MPPSTGYVNGAAFISGAMHPDFQPVLPGL